MNDFNGENIKEKIPKCNNCGSKYLLYSQEVGGFLCQECGNFQY